MKPIKKHYDQADTLGAMTRDQLATWWANLEERLQKAESAPPPTDAARVAAIKQGRDDALAAKDAEHAKAIAEHQERHNKETQDLAQRLTAQHQTALKAEREAHAATKKERDQHKQHAERLKAEVDRLDPVAAAARAKQEKLRRAALKKLSKAELEAIGIS